MLNCEWVGWSFFVENVLVIEIVDLDCTAEMQELIL
jgi:hypothetical protein